MDFFVDARHGAHERGLDFAQVVLNLAALRAKAMGAAVGERIVVRNGSLEGVREGQEREEHVFFVEFEALVDLLDVRDDVAVRDHHAFGPSRGARGVDEARKVVGRRGSGGVRRRRRLLPWQATPAGPKAPRRGRPRG